MAVLVYPSCNLWKGLLFATETWTQPFSEAWLWGEALFFAVLPSRHCGMHSPYLVWDIREAPSSQPQHITKFSSGDREWESDWRLMRRCLRRLYVPVLQGFSGCHFYQGSNEVLLFFFSPLLRVGFPYVPSYVSHRLPGLREGQIFQILAVHLKEGA